MEVGSFGKGLHIILGRPGQSRVHVLLLFLICALYDYGDYLNFTNTSSIPAFHPTSFKSCMEFISHITTGRGFRFAPAFLISCFLLVLEATQLDRGIVRHVRRKSPVLLLRVFGWGDLVTCRES